MLLKQSFRIQTCSITFTKERAKAEGVFYKIPLDFEKSKEISYYPRHEDAPEHYSFRLKQSSPVYLQYSYPVCEENTIHRFGVLQKLMKALPDPDNLQRSYLFFLSSPLLAASPCDRDIMCLLPGRVVLLQNTARDRPLTPPSALHSNRRAAAAPCLPPHRSALTCHRHSQLLAAWHEMSCHPHWQLRLVALWDFFKAHQTPAHLLPTWIPVHS